MTSSPYANLPPFAFWRSGVTKQPNWGRGLYRKRFPVTPETRVATAGSCFAQHIAQNLRKNGFRVLDMEPEPMGLTPEAAKRFGYRLYSARYGNIYTARQLLQLAREALGLWTPEDAVWSKGKQFYDALRPNVEPDGLESAGIVRTHRKAHLRQVARLLQETDLFVFTLGLTEAWLHRESGTVYPTAPGTVAGAYRPAVHVFKNFSFPEIYGDFVAFRALLKEINPDVKFLLTVSPVPLTATASGGHVLPATIYSKSVLRAVVGQLYSDFEDVDYFPSYEIIATPFSPQRFYEANLREVSARGVEIAMETFLAAHTGKKVKQKPVRKVVEPARPKEKTAEDLVCEDVLLEAFAR